MARESDLGLEGSWILFSTEGVGIFSDFSSDWFHITAKAQIRFGNLEMCCKILLKPSQLCPSERLWSPKNTCTRPWILQLLKKPLGKLADADDIDTLEAMRFELSINGVADGVLETVEICVLWVWLYWRALEIVSDTLSSWGADGLAL